MRWRGDTIAPMADAPAADRPPADRVPFRRFEPGDAPRVRELADDLELARRVASVPHPYTLELAAAWVQKVIAGVASGAADSWAIEVDRTLAGGISVFCNENGDDEVGYWLGADYRGRGLGTAVLRATLRRVAAAGARRLVARAMNDNPASLAVLRKCGFVATGATAMRSMARPGDIPGTAFLWRAE